ncbi:hypothetical protein HUA78_26235 [Myxococcus sp. CA033]|uniref:hypothetical protein n=1 Tax=Myxococcus sp. CA033 TaxID=2741516 RepID=UPI00157B3457|nr:hypothetical protein [Myxococcus sp. CA033]NTX37966.1 hypothetical protein [Myxococcus sp. CA033]
MEVPLADLFAALGGAPPGMSAPVRAEPVPRNMGSPATVPPSRTGRPGPVESTPGEDAEELARSQKLEAQFVARRAWRELAQLYLKRADRAKDPVARAEALTRLAEVMETELQDPAGAARMYREIVELTGDRAALREQVRLLASRDDASLVRRALDEAIQHAKTGRARATALLTRGERWLHMGEPQKARADFEASEALVPGLIPALAGLLLCVEDAERSVIATRLRSVLAATPRRAADRAEALRVLARTAEEQLDDSRLAQWAWGEVLIEIPDSEQARERLLWLARELGDMAALGQLLRAQIARESRGPVARQSRLELVATLESSGDSEAALNELRQAVRFEPGHKEAWLLLVERLLARDNKGEAAWALENAATATEDELEREQTWDRLARMWRESLRNPERAQVYARRAEGLRLAREEREAAPPEPPRSATPRREPSGPKSPLVPLPVATTSLVAAGRDDLSEEITSTSDPSVSPGGAAVEGSERSPAPRGEKGGASQASVAASVSAARGDKGPGAAQRQEKATIPQGAASARGGASDAREERGGSPSGGQGASVARGEKGPVLTGGATAQGSAGGARPEKSPPPSGTSSASGAVAEQGARLAAPVSAAAAQSDAASARGERAAPARAEGVRAEKPAASGARGEQPVASGERIEKNAASGGRAEKPASSGERTEQPVGSGARAEQPVASSSRAERPASSRADGARAEKPAPAGATGARAEKPAVRTEKPAAARAEGDHAENPAPAGATGARTEKPSVRAENPAPAGATGARAEKPAARTEKPARPPGRAQESREDPLGSLGPELDRPAPSGSTVAFGANVPVRADKPAEAKAPAAPPPRASAPRAERPPAPPAPPADSAPPARAQGTARPASPPESPRGGKAIDLMSGKPMDLDAASVPETRVISWEAPPGRMDPVRRVLRGSRPEGTSAGPAPGRTFISKPAAQSERPSVGAAETRENPIVVPEPAPPADTEPEVFRQLRERPLDTVSYANLADFFDTRGDAPRAALMREIVEALAGRDVPVSRLQRPSLTADERAGLRHPGLRTSSGELLACSGIALCRLFPAQGRAADASEPLRAVAGPGAPAVLDALHTSARVLAVNLPELVLAEDDGPPFTAVHTDKPRLLVGRAVIRQALPAAELRFHAGRALLSLSPDLLALRALKGAQLLRALALLSTVLKNPKDSSADARLVRETLSPRALERTLELLDSGTRDFNASSLADAARDSANRAGLVACGGVGPAVTVIRSRRSQDSELVELLRFAASERYLSLRAPR